MKTLIEHQWPESWPLAYGLARVSTIGQYEHGYGLETQTELILKTAEQRHVAVLAIYYDIFSGASADEEELVIERPGLLEMLSDMGDANVRLVVVPHTNRLWRGDLDKVLVQRALRRLSADVVSHDQPDYSISKVSSDPTAYLVNGVMEIVDVYQRLEIRSKLQRGRRTKATKGQYAGGANPIGYNNKRGSKELTVNNEKAEAVKRCLELHDQFPWWSLEQIANKLNDEGYLTRDDCCFTKVQVSRIIKRRSLYEGKEYHYGSISAPSNIPGITEG